MRSVQQIIESLIDNAKGERLILPTTYYAEHPGKDPRKIGEKILRLPPEERALLESLTIEDFNHRLDEVLKYHVEPGTTTARKGRLGKHLEEQRIQQSRKQKK